jgi:hypothetical protein
MSHVSCVNVEIKDLNALKRAAEELGLEFVEGQKTYKWYGVWVNDYHKEDAAYRHGIDPKDYGKCEHALRIPGDKTAYEVGVVKVADGTFKLIWDFYGGPGGKLRKLIGNKGELLLQGYSKEVATKTLAKKGFKVLKTEKLSNGQLKVVLRG